MDRRNFLKLASCAGLSVVSPSAWGGKDLSFGRPNPMGATEAHAGPFFLFFHAGGGWDPTHLCDPKTKKSAADPNPMTNLLQEDLDQQGNIVFPAFFDPMIYGDGAGAYIPEFFRTYADRLTVINGIDVQTNGHDSGTRHTWSGNLAEGYPTLAAYMAATFNPTLPMAFLAFSGYGETAGIAPRTRAGNLGVLANLAYPTRLNPDDEATTIHSSESLALIEEAQYHRDQALIEGQGLPRLRHAMNTLYEARSGSNELKLLQQYLPPDDQRQGGIAGQAQVTMAAFRAGISVSANLGVGGFDTHGNHDQSQIPRLNDLMTGIDVAMQEAERQGIADQVVIVVGSDFGRTPGYNDGNGKDHWSVTSMMFMGRGIPGNRVVGATTDGHKAHGITTSLDIDTSEEPALKINPAHIHSALREKYALGADNPLAPMFPLSNEERLPLFG